MIPRKQRPLSAVTVLFCGLLFVAMLSGSFNRAGRTAASETDRTEECMAASTQDNRGGKSSVSFVANSFCRACHLDFDEEELALDHELAGIGCERCHGESFRHRSDEANITPPELMYPKERVNPTCMMCHPRHSINHVKDHQPILEAGFSIFEEMPAADQEHKFCTDCHAAKHRMQRRTIRWNKATGELIR